MRSGIDTNVHNGPTDLDEEEPRPPYVHVCFSFYPPGALYHYISEET